MHKAILSRKEKIIITAIDLLDEVGIVGLTTKTIAQRQNITEAAIYKHFNGKMDIIIAILEKYAVFDQLIRNTIVENKIEGKAGIVYFVKAYAEHYQNYPQITTPMFSFDVYRYRDATRIMMDQIVQERYELLLQLLIQANEKGEIKSQTDCYALTDALFGLIWSTTLLWKFHQYSFDLKARLMQSIEVLLPKLFNEKANEK